MNSEASPTIWFSVDRSRYFLVLDTQHLVVGDYILTTWCGRQQTVDPTALAPYEITRDEAEAWLKAQLGDVLGELRNNLIDAVRSYFDSRKPSAHESPAELIEHAAAIETVANWVQHISPRAETRLRTNANAMRKRAAAKSTGAADE